MPKDAIYIQCRCGHRLSAWRILNSLARIIPEKTPSRAEVEPLLPRLRCNQCGARGKAEITFAPSTANRPSRYVATEMCEKEFELSPDETAMLVTELDSDGDDWARSEEDGWFYADAEEDDVADHDERGAADDEEGEVPFSNDDDESV